MRKYTKKELHAMVRLGIGNDITNGSRNDIPKNYDKVGYSSGTYGISGGIIQDRENGEKYIITQRNTLLLSIF